VEIAKGPGRWYGQFAEALGSMAFSEVRHSKQQQESLIRVMLLVPGPCYDGDDIFRGEADERRSYGKEVASL
jgi:hypothetical protein